MTRPSIVGTTVWLAIALCAPALAFHDGGVAHCGGCHVMHNDTVVPGPGGDGTLLLPERGAGNFVFLIEDNLNDRPDGLINPIAGEAAGHSIVAPGRGLSQDTRNAIAPGGTFPSSMLGCTSCHDPHGNSEFRLLYGIGAVQGGLAFFSSAAPLAQGIPLNSAETRTNHTAYRQGVSRWCGNCHGNYHENGISAFAHENNRNLGAARNQYNVYDGDDAPIGGSYSTAYLPEVPYQDNRPTNTTSSTLGASGPSRVMCLTCHRAHATSAPAAGRWDFNISLLADDGVVSGSYPIPDPYDSLNQGTLCTKCHSSGPIARPTPGRGRELDRLARPPRVTGPSRLAPR